MFDTGRFLRDNFKSPAGLIAFLSAYRAQAPKTATAEKWFQREAIPGDWLLVLLAYLELENGGPIAIRNYLLNSPGGPHHGN